MSHVPVQGIGWGHGCLWVGNGSGGTAEINRSDWASPSADTLVFDTILLLDIGAVEPAVISEAELGPGSHGAAVLSDGSIAVIQEAKVMLFDRNGKYRRSFGQRGDGPGEFRHIARISR